MGRKSSTETSSSLPSKPSKPREKLSVSTLLANMDKSKPKPNPKSKPSSYMDGVDLPPSDEEEEEIALHPSSSSSKPRPPPLPDLPAAALSAKEIKKREKKDIIASAAADSMRTEALTEDRDAFQVAIASQAPALDGDDAAANVRDIVIERFSVSAGNNKLLDDASLKITHSKRYGLWSHNGMGKSTLLKLLAWRKIPVPKNVDMLLVEQEVVGDDRTAVEAVVSANEELVKVRKEVDSLSGEDGDGQKGEKLAALYERLQVMGSDAAEANASKILAGLGFTKAMQGRATRSFSGGMRMKISFARALFIQPTLLLLDEPTNHLDLRAGLFLQQYLRRWKKTLVVVSHERNFLNAVCNEIIHLHDMKLHFYRGNFDDFERAYEQKRNETNKIAELYVKQHKAAKSKADQEKAKVRATAKVAKRKGKGKVDEDDHRPLEVPKKWRDYSVKFHFPDPTELTPPLLQLIEASFSYPSMEDFKLSDVDVGVDMGTRVVIVGLNGAGKSTLLNLLAGDLVPTEGEVRRSPKLRIGRYSQHFIDVLTMDEYPVQYLLRLHPDQEGLSKQEAVRAKLGKFGLASKSHLLPIAKLSGGQKARVAFTSISMSKPHILLLDEPTNHLDMQSIDALAEALVEFSGGVVLISHDSRLISRVCEDEERSELWVVEDGRTIKFPGSFEEYKEVLLREIEAEIDDLCVS